MSEYEFFKGNFCNLIAKIKENDSKSRNEATTRLQIIDTILFECLGWKKEDCIAEEPFDTEYTDYTLSTTHRCLIIEAKKEGIYFELPAGYEQLEYKISSLTKENKIISDAVHQAMNYCQKRGVSVGAVCNGHQIIAFIACRTDGIPPEKGTAIVFNSLDKMLDNFKTLWNYLSKDGVKEKKLENYLLNNQITIIPPKLSASINLYPGTKNRNDLQTDLQIVADLVIEEVSRNSDIEEKFIDECYCTSGALSQYALVSKTLLENRYSLIFDANDSQPVLRNATSKKGLSPEFCDEIISSRPIVLVGDVGVGKTMFIKNFINFVAKDIFKKAITLYIDLGSKAALTQDLRVFIINDIKEQLRNKYAIDIDERNFIRGIYNKELERFASGIYSDLKESDPKIYKLKEIEFIEQKITNQENHIRDSFIHIVKGRKQQIIIIFDNADQRDDTIQQQSFIISQEISVNWPVNVFIALRPQTFYKSKKDGSLSGYHPRAFTIAPPRVDEVIKKRLLFAIKIATGELRVRTLSHDISLKLKALQTYLEILIHSFTYNTQLIEFIDNICNGNIRLALEFITTFISSGHVDTKKILDKDEENRNINPKNRYTVPLHEFLRAIIYGDNEHYSPSYSHIANVFDITSIDGKEHFLLPILIEYIAVTSATAGQDGFIESKSLFDFFQNISYTRVQIESAISRGLSKKLIESEARKVIIPGDNIPTSLRTTTVGLYHSQKLLSQFAYIDAIVVDTPILNDNFRKQIKNVYSIKERIERSKIFIEYLNTEWIKIDNKNLNFNWNDIYKNINEQITKLKAFTSSINN